MTLPSASGRSNEPASTTGPSISVVVPVHNEESGLPELYRRVSDVLNGTGETWELILVDDGSRDRSAEVINQLATRDSRVRGLSLARNFGFQLAVTAGIDSARGDAVVLMDADLQDPPEVIPQFIEKWRAGYNVVYGVRSERAGETWFKRVTAEWFYRLIRRLTNVDIPLDTGDFRLMDKQVITAIRQMPEHNRFLRGMVSWVGYKQTGVNYKRAPRFAGQTSFTLRKMVQFALDAITGFSYVPLQLAAIMGSIIAFLSTIAIGVVVFIRLFSKQKELLGQATTLVAVLFLGGVQLGALGIIGEYLGRMYDDIRGRPLYLVARRFGTESTPDQ